MKFLLLPLLSLLALSLSCRGAPETLSRLKALDLTEGRYTFRSANSGLCLESPNNSKVKGTILQQWPCNGLDAQIFYLKRSGQGYQIANHDQSLVLDVKDIAREEGAMIQLWTANEGLQQQFAIDKEADGKVSIRSLLSGHVLDVQGISKAERAKVLQWHKTGGSNQLWEMERVRDADGWKLVWSDEFNEKAIDLEKWNFEVKGPRWVNNELQNYTNNRPENARIEDGQLVIEARRDFYEWQEYSSARLKTEGKASWTYGRIEARIKLPKGRGTWPAFWMMPDDQKRGWPACGEIDIMEHVGMDQDFIHATTHTEAYNWKSSSQRTKKIQVPGVSDGFHTYAVEWYPDRVDMFVDGKKYYTSANDNTGDDAYPFTKNFHIILNLAVGGDWGGQKGIDPSAFPASMRVDWVRVYQR